MWGILPRPLKVIAVCVVAGGCLIASFYLAWAFLAVAVMASICAVSALVFKIKDSMGRFEFEEID